MTDKPDLTALLGSRICHDLISPIGAVGNGIELMLMEGAHSSPEMALISESVAHANARIRFFRLAFGAAGSETPIARAEIEAVLSDLTRGTRLRLRWHSQPALPRASVKLACLLYLCVESALPLGGTIEVTQTEAGWSILARGPRVKADAALWEILTRTAPGPGPWPDLTPAQVHFPLVAQELARQHRRLTTEIGVEEIRFTF